MRKSMAKSMGHYAKRVWENERRITYGAMSFNKKEMLRCRLQMVLQRRKSMFGNVNSFRIIESK